MKTVICLCVTHVENYFNNQNIYNVVAIVEKLTLCDDVASLDIRPGLRKEVRWTNALISKFKS